MVLNVAMQCMQWHVECTSRPFLIKLASPGLCACVSTSYYVFSHVKSHYLEEIITVAERGHSKVGFSTHFQSVHFQSQYFQTVYSWSRTYRPKIILARATNLVTSRQSYSLTDLHLYN